MQENPSSNPQHPHPKLWKVVCTHSLRDGGREIPEAYKPAALTSAVSFRSSEMLSRGNTAESNQRGTHCPPQVSTCKCAGISTCLDGHTIISNTHNTYTTQKEKIRIATKRIVQKLSNSSLHKAENKHDPKILQLFLFLINSFFII